jgi:hypothetical protein
MDAHNHKMRLLASKVDDKPCDSADIEQMRKKAV